MMHSMLPDSVINRNSRPWSLVIYHLVLPKLVLPTLSEKQLLLAYRLTRQLQHKDLQPSTLPPCRASTYNPKPPRNLATRLYPACAAQADG